MGESTLEAPEAEASDVELRLLALIRENGERRERREGRAASEASPGAFGADRLLVEENGFELWLGSMEDALSLRVLRDCGFGAVLNCAVEECERECAAHRGGGRGRRRAHARGASLYDEERLDGGELDRDRVRATAQFDGEWYSRMLGRETVLLGISADDAEGYDMQQHFAEVSEFLSSCRAEGKKVLVHCLMGINRASVAAVAFMCSGLGMSLEEAVDLISKERGHVLSNRSFLRELVTIYGSAGAPVEFH